MAKGIIRKMMEKADAQSENAEVRTEFVKFMLDVYLVRLCTSHGS